MKQESPPFGGDVPKATLLDYCSPIWLAFCFEVELQSSLTACRTENEALELRVLSCQHFRNWYGVHREIAAWKMTQNKLIYGLPEVANDVISDRVVNSAWDSR